MGKTYVALGALALFRYFDPQFRILVLAPRGNIQTKWVQEYREFIVHNIRFPDARVKALDGSPARPIVSYSNLAHLLHETSVNPDRDFFARLTSFGLPLTGRESVDPDAAFKLRNSARRLEAAARRNGQGIRTTSQEAAANRRDGWDRTSVLEQARVESW